MRFKLNQIQRDAALPFKEVALAYMKDTGQGDEESMVGVQHPNGYAIYIEESLWLHVALEFALLKKKLDLLGVKSFMFSAQDVFKKHAELLPTGHTFPPLPDKE